MTFDLKNVTTYSLYHSRYTIVTKILPETRESVANSHEKY